MCWKNKKILAWTRHGLLHGCQVLILLYSVPAASLTFEFSLAKLSHCSHIWLVQSCIFWSRSKEHGPPLLFNPLWESPRQLQYLCKMMVNYIWVVSQLFMDFSGQTYKDSIYSAYTNQIKYFIEASIIRWNICEILENAQKNIIPRFVH